jgi:hypothetical protein
MTDETNVIDIETKKPKANHYIDNAAFLAALLEHRERVQLAKATDTALPQISNYLGDCFIKIAKHLSYKSNFINYSYKDEMIGDAVENCLAVVNNFDPAKSKNPFAYFAGPSRIKKKPVRLNTDALRSFLANGLGWHDINNDARRLTVAGVTVDLVGVDDPHIHYFAGDKIPARVAQLEAFFAAVSK